MSDYFALLQEPRRPWLDEGPLKQKFLAQSAIVHPDKIHSADETQKAAAAKEFAELNAAFRCLVEPKSRLLHLLELESGTKPADIRQIPAGLADLFAAVSDTCRQVDLFLAEKSKVTSPLVQVQWFERGQDWVEQLNALQQTLNGLREQLMSRLRFLDEKWLAADLPSRPALLPKL